MLICTYVRVGTNVIRIICPVMWAFKTRLIRERIVIVSLELRFVIRSHFRAPRLTTPGPHLRSAAEPINTPVCAIVSIVGQLSQFIYKASCSFPIDHVCPISKCLLRIIIHCVSHFSSFICTLRVRSDQFVRLSDSISANCAIYYILWFQPWCVMF